MKNKIFKIGLAGCGTVGLGVYQILEEKKKFFEKKLGFSLELSHIATRSPQKIKSKISKKIRLSSSWKTLLEDSELDLVIELMGGTEDAYTFVLQALNQSLPVVTANKALLAKHGKELLIAAKKQNTDLLFEAAVGGGIPILRALREGLSANEDLKLSAIINGTSNYILSQMTEKNLAYASTLKMAQDLGYAEADPTFDVEGIDAAHKLCLLISLAYGVWLDPNKIFTEGISRISPLDIEFAKRFGFVIKLLAITKKHPEGIEARVHPTMIPLSNPLAPVNDAFNAILLEGEYVGPSLLYGRGAGRYPTASAVVADIIEVAREKELKRTGAVPAYGFLLSNIEKANLLEMNQLESEYYLRLSVLDQPGVLAKVAGILGQLQISIASIYQEDSNLKGSVPLVLLTHRALEKNIQKAIKKIDAMKFVKEKTILIRIEK